jgi:hypothetical protein
MTVSADRIATPGGADNQGIGPKRVARNDSGTKTSRSAFGTTPTDVITQESEFHTEASGRFDARGSNVLTITLADNAGSDTWTITAYENGTPVGTTAALADDVASATVQTELRAILTGTDLVTVTVDSAGPGAIYTVTFNTSEFYSRDYPKLVVTGTGMTGVVRQAADPSVKRYLGETKYEGTTELVGPTIGTITVTDAVDEVQTLTFSAGTDGGRFRLGFRQGRSSSFAWDATVADIAAEMYAEGGMFDQNNALTAADAPTVGYAVPLSMELQFSAGGADFLTTDSAILTYDTTDASDALVASTVIGATAAIRCAVVEAWFRTINAFADSQLTVTEVTNRTEYDVVIHDGPAGLVVADFALDVTGSADEDATPDANTVQDESAGIVFTFENGGLAGRPIRGGVHIIEDTLEDGGVLEPATLTITTAGVLGSASAAYTEQTTVGDSVFGEAVNDATGKGGTSAAAKDTDSPVVFAGLVPGTYTAVLRTVADRALSAPSTKAFTVASA